MKRRRFGPLDVKVPVVGQGTWYLEREDRSEAIAALRRGVEAGATHIDTAELYGSGAVEKIVGEAISGIDETLFLVSKVLPSNASREGTVRACEQSIERLGVETLDCYLLHWAGSHPLEQTFEAFEELKEKNRIRSWGVSNFDEEEMARAVEVAGEGRIVCNQVLYHLEERSIEHKVIPFCRDRGIAVVAYSPFGSGRFPDPDSEGGRVLRTIAGDLEATPRQIALAFLLRHENVFVIPRTGDQDHAAQNAAAAEVELNARQIREIDRAFPLGKWTGGVPVL